MGTLKKLWYYSDSLLVTLNQYGAGKADREARLEWDKEWLGEIRSTNQTCAK